MANTLNPKPQLSDFHHVLPSSPYGLTDKRFTDLENPLLDLPQRDIMVAANQLNDYRYSKLSERQRVFIDIYLASKFNAAEAAKRAGYCENIAPGEDYEKACASIGRRLVKHDAIAIGI